MAALITAPLPLVLGQACWQRPARRSRCQTQRIRCRCTTSTAPSMGARRHATCVHDVLPRREGWHAARRGMHAHRVHACTRLLPTLLACTHPHPSSLAARSRSPGRSAWPTRRCATRPSASGNTARSPSAAAPGRTCTTPSDTTCARSARAQRRCGVAVCRGMSSAEEQNQYLSTHQPVMRCTAGMAPASECLLGRWDDAATTHAHTRMACTHAF